MELEQYLKDIVIIITGEGSAPTEIRINPLQHYYPAAQGDKKHGILIMTVGGIPVVADVTVRVGKVCFTKDGDIGEITYPQELRNLPPVGPIAEHFNVNNPSTIVSNSDPRIRGWLPKI